MTRKSGILARSQGRLRHLLRNAAQFNLIKAAEEDPGWTRVHSFVRSFSPTPIDIEEFSAVLLLGFARGEDTRHAARVAQFLVTRAFRAFAYHISGPLPAVERISRHGRLETAFTCKTFQERISRPHRAAPRLTAVDLYTRWVIAPGIFRRSGPTKTTQRLPFDAASPPGTGGCRIFPRDL